MSTQHPDNVQLPFFAESPDMSGADEIQEAYYAFSHLGCDEQMWDCEGKEVDGYVVKKLLGTYESYFRSEPLGDTRFITLRVPNPAVEKSEAKILLETLESIPRSYDSAKLFYGTGRPPIFEVILPMTASSDDLNRVYHYYRDFVAGKESKELAPGLSTVADWIGAFTPKTVNVIPLFETWEHMLAADRITAEYMKGKNLGHQRVFLARSDPAMNYGLVTAVLLNKIALARLKQLERHSGVSIYPILGVGSVPFRGGLSPHTVDRVTEEYPSVHTFTIQSSFKYDHAPADVARAIARLATRPVGEPPAIDEARALEISRKYTEAYEKQVRELAPVINRLARFVPKRRKRKLHIGLFGYARAVSGLNLPRAITFTATLYSLGVPPEILALNSLNEDDMAFLSETYIHFVDDLKDALQYCNLSSRFVPEEVRSTIERLPGHFRVDEEYLELTAYISRVMEEGTTTDVSKEVLRAAHIRKFLG